MDKSQSCAADQIEAPLIMLSRRVTQVKRILGNCEVVQGLERRTKQEWEERN